MNFALIIYLFFKCKYNYVIEIQNYFIVRKEVGTYTSNLPIPLGMVQFSEELVGCLMIGVIS